MDEMVHETIIRLAKEITEMYKEIFALKERVIALEKKNE